MSQQMKQTLTIAISKGRILKEALPLLSKIGIEPLEDLEKSRKLILETNRGDIKLVVIRATDVPTYVEYGAADLGITGKDVLVEHGGEQLYEPLDLKIAPCRLMLAQIKGAERSNPHRRLRVATKYVNITQRYFNQRGEQVELIKLYGSMELAPLVGLADRIVDLVDTGNTLKANGLEPTELILPVTSRLVANKASMKMKQSAILQVATDLKKVI